jgi:hypothetical protein
MYADSYHVFNSDIYDYQAMSATGPTGATGHTGATGATGSNGDPLTILCNMFQIPAASIETIPRMLCTVNFALGTGSQRFTYFTAYRNLTVSNVTLYTTTAGSGLTMSRVGLYTVDAATGDVTLVASTANDATFLATSQTVFTRSLNVSYSLVAGTQYSVGVLCVGAGAPGLAAASNVSSLYSLFAALPRLAGYAATQTDLPSSFAASGMGTANEAFIWARLS